MQSSEQPQAWPWGFAPSVEVSWSPTLLLHPYLPACLPSYLPSYLATCIPVCLGTYLYLLPTRCKGGLKHTPFLHLYVPTYLPAACLPVCLPVYGCAGPSSEPPLARPGDFALSVEVGWSDDMLTPTGYPPPNLAFTSYSFPARLLCTNQPSVYSPRPPALSTLVQYDCTIIGQYTTPPPNSRLKAMHHTILVITIWCKGQFPTQQPTWLTSHTAHSQHCGHTALPPG